MGRPTDGHLGGYVVLMKNREGGKEPVREEYLPSVAGCVEGGRDDAQEAEPRPLSQGCDRWRCRLSRLGE